MITKQIAYLSSFALDQRVTQLRKVLAARTRYITVCLEDIYQPQNASAVLRTCDAVGVQDIHIIEKNNEYTISTGVALGTDKWLDLYKYNNSGGQVTQDTIGQLRAKGYRIVATTPRENSTSLEDFDLSAGKVALFFGTELTGLSTEMMAEADEFLHVPMMGFVESFNISVSASIILYNLLQKLRTSDLPWQLSQGEADDILLRWLKLSVRRSDLLLERFAVAQK